ncbi:hypothetical protein EIP91_000486 [Steccherinum ochraceum]|uniref:BTB domain-containing protein n=1 Tax=Steccherinum ochraceum TaxID=92696 RepID=A0A4R0S1A2_9APHY|nr:hypothetical protein EIP91_000486 [Steccherinum ochraceum]
MAPPRGKKRKTSAADASLDESLAANEIEVEHGKIWFEDGSTVLIAEGKGFKVYQGILSQHSEVFRDMFTLPQPPEAETCEGCPIVHMQDTAEDLLCFLTALHDSTSRYFDKDHILTFIEVSAMLRLGSKYQVERIRAEAVRRLELCFPDDLDSFCTTGSDSFIYCAPDFPYFYEPSRTTVSLTLDDCKAVINLARAHDLNNLLPAAFYSCTLIATEELVLQKHKKIIGGTSWVLSDEDAVLCIELKSWFKVALRINIAASFVSVGDDYCQFPDSCQESKSRMLERLFGKDLGGLALLDSYSLTYAPISTEFCHLCTEECKQIYSEKRQAVWEKLHEYFAAPAGSARLPRADE